MNITCPRCLYEFNMSVSRKDADKIVSPKVSEEKIITAQLIIRNNELLTLKEAAIYLNIKEKTLSIYRTKGIGPAFIKRGRIFYSKTELDKWMMEGTCRSTVEERFKNRR